MKISHRSIAALLYVLLLLSTSIIAKAQEIKMNIDAATRKRVIDSVLIKLNEQYVFPEVAAKMEATIRQREAGKEYDTITDAAEFATKLTQDLRDVCHDRHLSVNYSQQVLPPDSGKPMEATGEELDNMRRQTTRENFGFERVEVFPGNIGYLKINYFVDPDLMGETLRGAFDYIGNTDALIIDLRDNGGSMSDKAIPRFCSYLFEKPTHINSLYWRPQNKTTDYYTLADVPGKRYLNKPIYVLTSGRTFSGAEEFAYDLQNLKRAVLIGEMTGGGANGGGSVRVDDHFEVWIPIGRAINPITKTNWEGVGVKPEIMVPAVKAFYSARIIALEALVEKTVDSRWKEQLQEILAQLKANPPQLKKVVFELKGFPNAKTVTVAGTFNSWSTNTTVMWRTRNKWQGEAEMEPGRHQYKFIVDGKWIIDPANPKMAKDRQFTNSLLIVN